MSRLSLLSQDTTNDLVVNIGDTPNDKTGDPLRTAFNKIKNSISRSDDNFVELYSITGSIPEDISDLTDTNNLLSGSSSIESLNDLNDVSYSVLSIQDGQLLRWNSLDSKFTAGSVSWEDIAMTPAIPEDISELTDNTLLLTSYNPTTPSDWEGTAPTSIKDAIDRLASAFKAANGTGA